MASVLILSGTASWATAGGALAADTDRPAHLEDIPGSELKRVVLAPKAAERLAITTEPVREEPVMRWMLASGEVEAVTMNAAADQEPPDSGVDDEESAPFVVRVPLVGDDDQINGHATLVLSLGSADDETDDDDDDDEPGSTVIANSTASDDTLVLPVGDEAATPLKATQIAARPGGDANAQYYQVSESNYNLKSGQRVFVRVPQPGSGEPQRVIPYSAVIYDATGKTWAYTNPEALTYVRHPIDVEYIEGDLAVLKDGPAVGTPVVTAGAAELLGVEQGVGH
jgi:hypothetical protein